MKKRRSAITNLPTSGLLVRLEQYERELYDLKQKQFSQRQFNPVLCQRIRQIEDAMYFIKNVVIKRYIEEDAPIHRTTLLFINSNGIKAEVYEEVFVTKVMQTNCWVETNLLEKVIDKLSLENLIKISCAREKSFINEATKNYVLEEYEKEELKEGIKNLELEDIWFVDKKDDEDILYKLVKLSIDDRLFNVPMEVEHEVFEKIKIDKKEGNENDKYKGKRKIK